MAIGVGQIRGMETVVLVQNFAFMGGSLGMAAGEGFIKAAETAMINELRDKAASLAIASAAQIITSKLDDKSGLALIDDAASDIEKLN